eukprot:snap_masked-scaffold_17-processed-gene-6.33-mRNA-1 protein AED:1.00 eAED:1.00 QI:0/0/0/0/1/1/2/0/124
MQKTNSSRTTIKHKQNLKKMRKVTPRKFNETKLDLLHAPRFFKPLQSLLEFDLGGDKVHHTTSDWLKLRKSYMQQLNVHIKFDPKVSKYNFQVKCGEYEEHGVEFKPKQRKWQDDLIEHEFSFI